MFRSSYQSGFLSLLYSIGSKPLSIWGSEGERPPGLPVSGGGTARHPGQSGMPIPRLNRPPALPSPLHRSGERPHQAGDG